MLNYSCQEHTDSYYFATRNIEIKQPPLTASKSADVCIIGAGFFGLSTALELAEKGKKVIVLEGSRVGFGASGRNGGQAINGFEDGIDEYIKQVGEEAAHKLWNMSMEALDIIDERIAKYGIQCDWKKGYLEVALNERRMDDLISMKEACSDIFNYQGMELWDKEKVSQHLGSSIYLGGLFDKNSGHLHPLNYCLGLAKACLGLGVEIYEQSPVIDLIKGKDQQEVKTANASVTAKDVVIACNAYIADNPKSIRNKIDNKILPVESCIIATEVLSPEVVNGVINNGVSVCDNNRLLDYYRISGDNRLLFGSDIEVSDNLTADMYRKMLNVFPQLDGVKIDYTWKGPCAMTLNANPYIGQVTSHIYFANGFSGHGVALTGVAGRVVSEAILGNDERLKVFGEIPVPTVPGGKLLKSIAVKIGTMYYRFLDKYC